MDELDVRFHEIMRDLMPQEARSRYYQKKNGPMFFWTTQPFNLYDKTDIAQGKYESVVYRPVGKGAKSGKAQNWKRDESTSKLHTLRKDAKARAYRMYCEWLDAS